VQHNPFQSVKKDEEKLAVDQTSSDSWPDIPQMGDVQKGSATTNFDLVALTVAQLQIE